MREFVIDGANFADADGFYREFCSVVVRAAASAYPCAEHINLDAFNDLLSWPFWEDHERYTLIWRNSEISRAHLGYVELANWLRRAIQGCHEDAANDFSERLRNAVNRQGPSMFDLLLEIIRKNSEYIVLVLE